MASRKDIAIKAGVSQATVTNVFNRTKFVSADVRDRVMRAAEEVGYNEVSAQEFVLLVKDAENPYNAMLLSGMRETAAKYGADASMVVTDENVTKTISNIAKRKVAGVFSAIAEENIEDEIRRFLLDKGIGFSSSWEDFQIEFQTAINQVITYLFNMGHSRIAYLSGISMKEETNLRYAAFCNAIENNGGIVYRDLLVDGTFPYNTDIASGYQAMKKLLSAGVEFTAVFALNDLMAIGAARALQEAGMQIPADVSIVGCDNICFGEYFNPPLTTLDVSAREMGRQIVYTLLQKGKGIMSTPRIHIVPQLVLRGSTGVVTEKTYSKANT